MSHWKKIAKKNRKNRALKLQRKPPKEGSCRVTLLGEEPRFVVGGTPLGAPYLSSALAEQLLEQLPEQQPGSTLRFEYYPNEFFTFSWELHAPLLVRLARFGARLEFCVNCDGPYSEEFEIKETTVDLRALTGERDPDELTSRLGVTPLNISRRGDQSCGERVREQGYWRWGIEVAGYSALDERWRELFAALPNEAPTVCADYSVTMGITLTVVYAMGGFSLEADTVARLAAFNAPLACWLFP